MTLTTAQASGNVMSEGYECITCGHSLEYEYLQDVQHTLIGAWALLNALIANIEDVRVHVADVLGITTGSHDLLPVKPESRFQTFLIPVDWTSTKARYLENVAKVLQEPGLLQHDSKKRSDTSAQVADSVKLALAFDRIDESGDAWAALNKGKKSHLDDNDFPPYDLVLFPRVHGDTLTLGAFHCAPTYTGEKVKRLLRQYERLHWCLSSSNDAQSLSSFDMVCALDRQQWLQWNTILPREVRDCVHQQVEERCRLQPTSQAICAWDASFTYAELNQYANQLSSKLIKLGARPGAVVAFCFNKSAWTGVAILAILKAGCVIVAIDPVDNKERAIMIIEAARVEIVLAGADCYTDFEGLTNQTIMVSAESVEQLRAFSRAPAVEVSPNHRAWIIFTSGSTGKPKGVVLTHANLCTSAEASGNAKHIEETSRVLQFSSHIFDGVIQDYLFTLIRGGCVCVPSELQRRSDLAECMNKLKVNWTFLTPSVVNLLTPSEIPQLKVLTLGGEALNSDNVHIWADKVVLQNTYGPAEVTVGCVVREYEGVNGDPRNIGFPIGTVAWIGHPQNAHQLVPHGCIGELLLEGPMLAEGYLNDPVATSKAFLLQPQWLPERPHSTPSRVYRTGDLVRREDDGSLVFLGRRDDQIKLRGQRVELSALADFFSTNQLVQHAYVTVPTAGRLKGTLTCALSLKTFAQANHFGLDSQPLETSQVPEAQTQLASVKEDMSRIFSSYMVPTSWLLVHGVPLTPSGKLDGIKIKQWIIELDDITLQRLSGGNADQTHEAPTTTSQKTLQTAWADVLGVPSSKIGLQSSFFALGGNSLAAMVLTGRLRDSHLKLSAMDILKYPTLREMASVAVPKFTNEHVHTQGIPRLHGSIADIAQQCHVSLDDIEEIYPAAPFQEAMLALTTRDPGAYVVHRRFHLPDFIDRARLHAAWFDVCRANPVLRTRLVHDARHGTLQVVIKDTIPWTESSDVGEDLDEAFTFGSTLLRLQTLGRILTLSIHHAIYDGWSIALILGDVETAYHTGRARERPGFKQLIEYLESTDEVQTKAYWQRRLDAGAAVPFPSQPSSIHPPQCTGSVRRMIRMQHRNDYSVTTATVVTAAWSLVLSSYLSSEDVCFGLITSGRFVPLDGIEEIIGPLVTIAPMRLKVERDETVHAFLQQLHQDMLNMMPHMHYGLQKIQQISSDVKSAASFNNTFVVHPGSQTTKSSSLWSPEDVEELNPADFRTYPFHVSCTLQDDNLDVKMRFDPAVIDPARVQHLIEYFSDVVQNIAANPEGRVGDVLKPKSDLEQSIVISTLREEPLGVDICVHTLIESQVKSQSNSLAIESWDRSLTYAELNDLSNRLAHYLVARGVLPETHVCFCFEKSSLPLIAILAIIKAGGACVPIDISYPPDRIRTVLGKSQTQLVLCSARQSPRFSSIGAVIPIIVDHMMLSRLPVIGDQACTSVTPEHAVYTMFTSGSSGVPKGVTWQHSTLASSSQAHGPALGITSSSRVLQFSAYMWDISVCECITTLIQGGCVCVPSEDQRMNETIDIMNTMRVNWSWFTPTFARSVDLRAARYLHTLVLGGEVIGQDNVERYRDHFRLLTGYGPTECCVATSVADFSGNPHIASGNIGYPIGCHYWIVDPEDPNTLVPLGAIGEIVIEGPIVCRGYLGDSKRTYESFITNPQFGPKSSHRRYYRSGDLGRWNTDRSMQFFGRKDDQVKVRGQRLELGEVEHHILSFPEVTNAMALVPISQKHAGCLVAVITVQSIANQLRSPAATLAAVPMSERRKSAFVIHSLETHLSTKLPPFAVPTIWLVVSAMAMTPAGKLDRLRVRQWACTALENPSAALFAHKAEGVPVILKPTTSEERILCQTWASVLGISAEDISVDHSFHQLQGDSIHAIKLVAALRKQGQLITVAKVFDNPVLRDMAAILLPLPVVNEEAQLVSLVPGPWDAEDLVSEAASFCSTMRKHVEDIYPVTPLQEAVMSLNMLRPGTYFAQLVYEIPGKLDVERLQTSWNLVSSHHTILRTRIVHLPNKGTFQVVVHGALPFTFHTDLKTYLSDDLKEKIELGHAMARLGLIENRIVLTAHHACYDGFSLPMIIEDLIAAYRSMAHTPRPPFRKFVEYLHSTDVRASEQFWTTYLSDHTPPNFPRPSKSTRAPHADSTMHLDLKSTLVAGVTWATVANAAWSLVLALYGDCKDVSYGTTLSGRDVPLQGVSDLPGPTLATVPIRYTVQRQTPAYDFLLGLQKTIHQILPHEHLGLQHIRRLHDDAKAACEFKTVLVVFPSDDQSQRDWTLNSDFSTGDMDNFSMYPLVVLFHQTLSGASVTFNYDSHLVPKRQMSRIVNTYREIMLRLLDASERTCVDDLLSLTPEDRSDVELWNAGMPVAAREYIHEVISELAGKIPTATAVTAWDGMFSYKALDMLSNRLAVHLRSLGAREGVFIGYCLPKSKYAVVAVLAILKSGAAFAPLNPTDSVERRNQLIDQCGIEVVLVSRNLSEKDFEMTAVLVDLNDEFCENLPVHTECLPKVLQPNSHAFCIFTSGTTGQSKIVAISHTALTTSILSLVRSVKILKHSRCLQFASHVFDLSVLEMLGPLSVGGCICVPSEEARMTNLPAAANEMGVTWAFLTPTLARSLQPQQFYSLKTLLLAGEVVGDDNIEKWVSKVQLLNGWAPSETTIINTVTELERREQNNALGVAVNCRCWLVQSENPHMLAPVGAPGEIAVEGPILATGYLNDPERTSQAFVTGLKWAADVSRRFYLTGDIAFYDADGHLRFVGRRDTQTKIRGQRLDLGDVEYHLCQSTYVQDGVALSPLSGRFAGSLVAVFTLRVACGAAEQSALVPLSGSTVREQTRAIERRLREGLASHAVPSVLIPVGRLPQTASGKLDRRSVQRWLTILDEETVALVSDVMASQNSDTPSTPVEFELRSAWAAVLGLHPERIGRESSFFQLGGDSISAMQVVARCRSANIDLTIQVLMKNKTIASIAQHVSITRSVTFAAGIDDGKPFALSPIQQLFGTLGAVHTRFNQSFMLETNIDLRLDKFKEVLGLVIERHDMLHSRLRKRHDNEWEQFIVPASSKDVCAIHATCTSHANIEAVLEQTQARIDITNGPVLAAALIRMPARSFIFLTAHHMVIDLVSYRVVIQELETALAGRSLARTTSVSFKHWLRLQNDSVKRAGRLEEPVVGKTHPAEVAHWSLREAQNLVSAESHTAFTLSKEVTDGLFGPANLAFDTEPIDLLLSGLWIALFRTFKDRKVPTIYTEAHGRDATDVDADVTQTVGWFTVLQSLALDVEGRDDMLYIIPRMKHARRRVQQKDVDPFTYSSMTGRMNHFFGGSMPPVEVLFNFAGSFRTLERQESLFQLVPRSRFKTNDHAKHMQRLALLDFELLLQDGRLQVDLAYNEHMVHFHRTTDLMRELDFTYRSMIALSDRPKEMTLSEYPLLLHDVDQFETLVNDILPKHNVQPSLIEDIYPVTALIDLLLLAQQTHPEQNNVLWIVQINALPNARSLDLQRLVDAWREVVNRHTVLRSVVFAQTIAHVFHHQIVLKQAEPAVKFIEAQTKSEAERKIKEFPRMQTEMGRPDHSFIACQLPTGEVYLRLELNHALVDGSSFPNLWRDLYRAYHGTLSRKPPPLFADSVAYVYKQPLEANTQWWKNYLAGSKPSNIPLGRKPDVAEDDDEQIVTDVSAAVDIDEVHEFCRMNGLTIPSVIVAAWILMIATFSGSTEVTTSLPGSGRDIPVDGVEEMIGPLLVSLWLRIDLREDETTSSLLQRVQAQNIENSLHQHYKFLDVITAFDEVPNTGISIMARTELPKPEDAGMVFKHVSANDFAAAAVFCTAMYARNSISLLVKTHKAWTHQARAKVYANALVEILNSLLRSPDGFYSDFTYSGQNAKRWAAELDKIV